MKKKYVLIALELFGLEIFFSILSLFFYPFFEWIHNDIIYSIFTAWLFLGAVHSTFWQLGNKERKNIIIQNNHLKEGEPPIKQKQLTGAKIAFPFFIVNILVIVIAYFHGNAGMNAIWITHRIFQFTFAGFLGNETHTLKYVLNGMLVCLVMYIPCITGYISGAHNFSLIEKYFPKIIYKQKKKPKKDTKTE